MSCGAIQNLKLEALNLVSFLFPWYWKLRQFSHLTSFTADSLSYHFTFFFLIRVSIWYLLLCYAYYRGCHNLLYALLLSDIWFFSLFYVYFYPHKVLTILISPYMISHTRFDSANQVIYLSFFFTKSVWHHVSYLHLRNICALQRIKINIGFIQERTNNFILFFVRN